MRKPMYSVLLAFCLGAACTIPRDAAAQLRGRVVDLRGEPVAGARVAAWAGFREARSQTDEAGRFELPGWIASHTALTITASRTGYQPLRQPLGGRSQPLILTLADEDVPLPRIGDRAAAESPCSTRDEPEARALWQAAAGRYERIADSVELQSAAASVAGFLPRAELGRVELDSAVVTPVFSLYRSIDPRSGYGTRSTCAMVIDFGAWFYPFLHHEAQHFISEDFGRNNALRVASRTAEGTVLAFCSRSLGRGTVGIQGTLLVSPEGTLVSAEWRFRTPRPREDAGGEVVFAPHPGGTVRPWLVPRTGFYWRALDGSHNLAFQRWWHYGKWTIAPRASYRHLAGQ